MSKFQNRLIMLFIFSSISLLAAKKITILHLNDTHGQIEPLEARDGKTYGGFARIAFLVDSLRKGAEKDNRVFYFLHAGDALQGPPLSNIYRGELDFEFFNMMSLTAMAVGNHEFDFGPERIMELKKIAQFPLLSANIVDTLGECPFQPFLKKTVDGERVLIVGLTTESTSITTHPTNVEGLQFLRSDSVLTALLDSLGYGDKDLVIVTSHLGWDGDSALAEQVSLIDLIIGGHSHSILEKPHKINNALITQAGAKGIYLGCLDLEIRKGNIKSYDGELIIISEKIPEDAAIAARITQATEELDEQLNVPIGKTEIPLVPGLQGKRKDVISIGDFLARLMLVETGADFACTNQGGVRATIQPGVITMKHILTALPFQNTVVTMELTGEQVQKLLDYNLALGLRSGGTLHLTGVEFREKEGKAVDIRIEGVPFDATKWYTVATNNFLAAGGDGYKILTQGQNIYNTDTSINSLLVRYLERVGTITPLQTDD